MADYPRKPKCPIPCFKWIPAFNAHSFSCLPNLQRELFLRMSQNFGLGQHRNSTRTATQGETVGLSRSDVAYITYKMLTARRGGLTIRIFYLATRVVAVNRVDK